MRLLLPLILTLVATAPSADVVVSNFEGAPEQYLVVHAGEETPPRPGMLLGAGDLVSVRSDEGRLTLVDLGGRTLVLRGAEEEYRVPEAASPTWLDNAFRASSDWWLGLWASNDESVATIARGEDDPPRLLGMVRGENLVPNTLKTIRLDWDGGSAPYRLEIAGDGGIVWNAVVESGPAEIPLHALTEEWYRVRISIRRQGSEIRDAGEIFLVPVDELPEQARAIVASPLPTAIKNLYVSLALAAHPEWRFAALQYAIAGEDARHLEKALLAGRSPVGE